MFPRAAKESETERHRDREANKQREIGRQTDTESSRHTEREAEIVLDLLSLVQATV